MTVYAVPAGVKFGAEPNGSLNWYQNCPVLPGSPWPSKIPAVPAKPLQRITRSACRYVVGVGCSPESDNRHP